MKLSNVQSDLKNLWDDLRVLLKQPVEYYTIKVGTKMIANLHSLKEYQIISLRQWHPTISLLVHSSVRPPSAGMRR